MEMGQGDLEVEETSSSSLKKKSYHPKIPQYLVAAAVTIGGFNMGNALGWSSPVLPKLTMETSGLLVGKEELSLIGSLLTIGAAFGALCAGISVEYFGRKTTMIFSAVVFCVGWTTIVFANAVSVLFLGRFLTGLGVGILSLVAPIFLTEMSQSEVRGIIGVAFQLIVVLGVLFSATFGAFLSWRLLSAMCAVVPTLFGLSLLFVPESPRFLLKKGNPAAALRSLRILRSCRKTQRPEVTEEFHQMQGSLDPVPTESESEQTSNVSSMFLQSSTWKPILITLSLVLFNQCCGFNAIVFYTVDIFRQAEGLLESNMSSIIVQMAQLAAVLLSSALVDRAGRRVLLLSSFLIMSVSLGALGVYFYLKHDNNSDNDRHQAFLGWLPLGSVILFNVGYSVGIGSLVWTVMSEILPTSIVGYVYALETSYNWLLAFLITKYFHLLQETLTVHNTFWLFGGCCLLAFLVIFFTVPETKGKSLEEIQQKYFKEKRSESKSDLVIGA